MASPLSQVYARSMQLGMAALVQIDRRFGNLILDDSESPHPLIRRLRERGNVLRSYMINGWIVLAHEDVRALLQDRRVSSRVFDSGLIQRVLRAATAGEAVPLLDHPSLINIDAPDHTRLRRLSAKGFTNRYVQSLAPDIEQIVTELLDPLANQAEFDALDTLARPLPAIVIAEMLGVPREERHRFEASSAKLVRYTEVLAPEALAEAAAGDREMRAYLSALAEAKRTTPTSDLLSTLVAAEEDEEALDIDELLSLCTLLLVAGHETTTRLLGSCLYLLLQHPEQLAAVRADRSLIPAALEEALRLEPPVLAVSRLVGESFEYKGTQFKKGQMLLLSIAAANRDPALLDAPDAFDIHRKQIPHTSFGHGVHLCLGMPLARLETEIAMNALLDRYPTMEAVTQDHDWEDSPFFRGLRALPIRVDQAATACTPG